MPYLSALEVCSQQGAIEIYVYLYLYSSFIPFWAKTFKTTVCQLCFR